MTKNCRLMCDDKAEIKRRRYLEALRRRQRHHQPKMQIENNALVFFNKRPITYCFDGSQQAEPDTQFECEI